MHTLYCILGRTSSGKSSIAKEAAKKLNMTVLKSYTTRSMRPGETVDNSDHIFISPDDVEKYKPNMVAYTDRVGYCSFATKEQRNVVTMILGNGIMLQKMIRSAILKNLI